MAAKLTRRTHKIVITTAPSGRQLYHSQFSLQAASPETFGYTLVRESIPRLILCFFHVVVFWIMTPCRLVMWQGNNISEGHVTSICCVKVKWYRTTSLHGVITQKTTTWIFIAVEVRGVSLCSVLFTVKLANPDTIKAKVTLSEFRHSS
jgi:hypothetical protein